MTLALRTRLTLVYTAVFGVLLALFGAASYRLLARQLDEDVTANLTQLTSGLHGYLRFEGGAPTLAFDRTDAEQGAFVGEATRYYQIYDAGSGRLLAQSDSLPPLGLGLAPAEVRAFRDQPQFHDFRTDYGRFRFSNSVISPAAGQSYLLQVGLPLDGVDATLDRFLELLLWGVPLGLAAAVLAGRWMAGVALTPLTQFARATRRIDIANLAARLPVRGAGDEIDTLAEAFNDTLGRLEHAVGEMRQFSAALAHELRTPLTALRGEIELMMRQASSAGRDRSSLASQLEEIDKLRRLIDQLLTLARAEAGEITLARDRVDLSAMSETLVDQLELVAGAKAIDLHCEASNAVVVQGDAQWLERLLLNLVDNAIKFTPEGGRVGVRVFSDAHDATIEVRDTGVGMSREVAQHVFERFFRADPARSPSSTGAGLGLSLVKWIVDRHGGRIQLASEPDRGSTFSVQLPLSAR